MLSGRRAHSPTGDSRPGARRRSGSNRSPLRRCRTWGPVTRSIAVVPELVVVTGPIGSGKSSVTKMLAGRFSEAGRSAAVVDLDDIVAMLHAPLEKVEQSWERARDVHGRLVGEWLSSGVDVVIVDGP